MFVYTQPLFRAPFFLRILSIFIASNPHILHPDAQDIGKYPAYYTVVHLSIKTLVINNKKCKFAPKIISVKHVF